MPNRILKDSINESKGLSQVSPFAQDLYKRLITYADDYGRFNSDTEIMRARLYPRELDAVSMDDLWDAIIELCGVGKIILYTGADRRVDGVFGYFPKWDEHQRIRNTRAKCPEPGTITVNDWALRRFIPIELKIKIYERDGFVCQECKRAFVLPGIPTKQAMRLLNGAMHIDHIVPVEQGGRATEENLRLLCASCNLRRRKRVTVEDLLQFAADCGELQQVAASGGNSRPESNPTKNPIQLNPSHTAHDDDAETVTTDPNTQAVRNAYDACGLLFSKTHLDTHLETIARNGLLAWQLGFAEAMKTGKHNIPRYVARCAESAMLAEQQRGNGHGKKQPAEQAAEVY